MLPGSRILEDFATVRETEMRGGEVSLEVKVDLIFRAFPELFESVARLTRAVPSKEEVDELRKFVDNIRDPVIRRIHERLDAVEADRKASAVAEKLRTEFEAKLDEQRKLSEEAREHREELRRQERREDAANRKTMILAGVSVAGTAVAALVGTLVWFFTHVPVTASP